MAMDPAALELYLQQNPAALAQAIRDNPAAFSSPPPTNGMGADGNQLSGSTAFDAQLAAARDGSWVGNGISEFFDRRSDTSLPVEDRQAIAEAYAFRYGMPYNDPTVPYTVPDVNGMGSDGGQRTPINTGGTSGGPDWQGSSSHDAAGNIIPGGPADPATYEWDPGSAAGYNPSGQGAAQWNWGEFGQGAPSLDGGGGYDPNDYAFDRYVPGQESPWGIPEVQGGNKDFYRNQFVNLLRGEQNFQNKQRDAVTQRQYAAANPVAAAPNDWSWIEGGLPQVELMDNGYAKPLQGLDLSRSGYQQGGAQFFFNPMTGAYGPYGGGAGNGNAV
jgi:hypothetical protein